MAEMVAKDNVTAEQGIFTTEFPLNKNQTILHFANNKTFKLK